jgi:uncharacterized glyoxalase superfamily protein PhnB
MLVQPYLNFDGRCEEASDRFGVSWMLIVPQ